MKQKIVITSFLLTVSTLIFGQTTFQVNTASTLYNVEIQIENCDEYGCEGKATIQLQDKKTSQLIGSFKSPDLYIYLNAKPDENSINELKPEESPVQFGDYNFDGQEDMTILNGHNSSYGGPSFDIYLFDKTTKKLTANESFTELATNNLGMFDVDSARKRIITYQKDGAALHYKEEYTITEKNEPILVLEVEEDATEGETVKVTTKELKNGKWESKKETFSVEEYYK